MNEFSAYFKGKIIAKYSESRKKKEYRYCGFLWLRKKEYTTTVIHFFVEAVLEGLDDEKVLKIPVRKEIYDQIKIDDRPSIHLSCEYDYTCFHGLQQVKKENRIEVEDENKSY